MKKCDSAGCLRGVSRGSGAACCVYRGLIFATVVEGSSVVGSDVEYTVVPSRMECI